jgi:CRISPR/Cas system-associated exonuclease Cas4 (RecB family)
VVLNPAQQSVIDLLGRSADRVVPPRELAHELEAELNDELADLADHIDPAAPVWVSKHALTTIHGCEAQHAAGQGAFEWNVSSARGTVAHKAIEVLINYRGEPNPPDLVDEALARLADDEHAEIGRFIANLGEFTRAELRALAVDRVTAFQETFPPLKSQWVPRTESRSRVELLDGRVVLSGKSDLTLGRPGDKVIIDLKTGRPSRGHREDLRFYALLETIKLGTPPRKVASYYLEAARTDPEDVTEGTLRAAARRTVDGVRRIVAVTRLDVLPTKRPGPHCRWCTLLAGCTEGRDALARADDPEAAAPW